MPDPALWTACALLGWVGADPAGSSDGAAAAHRLFGHDVQRVEPLDPAEVEARRRAFEAMLQARGWGEFGDQILPRAADGPLVPRPNRAAAWTEAPHRATIFVNFFGGSLRPGDNADLDESDCVNVQMDWPGFEGTEAQAQALVDVFERQVEPYGIRIAYDERPPGHLPYAMVMMGGEPQMLGMGANLLGASCSTDCGDHWWRDTTFAFAGNVVDLDDTLLLGNTALHEAAHGFGLSHIADATKIMNPWIGSDEVTWADTCTPYDDSTGTITCQSTHDEFCAGEGQNSHAELLAYFGPNSPDLQPPVVDILLPADETRIEVTDAVTIQADITDDHEGVGWKLVIPEADQESIAYAFEKRWELSNLPRGVYTVRVEAIDHDRNEAADEITLYVGMDPPGATGDDETSSTSDEGDGTSGGEPTSGTESPPTAGEEPPGDAGGCRTADAPPASWAWLLLPWLVLRRRPREAGGLSARGHARREAPSP